MDFVLTINMPRNIIFRGTFFISCDLIEMGMQTPMIHRNDGKMKSAGWMPFQVACSSHLYLPAPLFANIIVTIANPRNVSRLHNRDDVRRTVSISFSCRPSLSKWTADSVSGWNRFRRITFAANSTNATADTNSKAMQRGFFIGKFTFRKKLCTKENWM